MRTLRPPLREADQMVFLEAVPLSALPPVVPAFWTHPEPEKEFVLPEGTSQWACAPADTAAGSPGKAAGSGGGAEPVRGQGSLFSLLPQTGLSAEAALEGNFLEFLKSETCWMNTSGRVLGPEEIWLLTLRSSLLRVCWSGVPCGGRCVGSLEWRAQPLSPGSLSGTATPGAGAIGHTSALIWPPGHHRGPWPGSVRLWRWGWGHWPPAQDPV